MNWRRPLPLRAVNRSAALALALVLAFPAPAAAAPVQPSDALATSQALTRLLAADARLQSIGWKLARANAPFCRETAPAIGLLLLDAANYRDPAAIRSALRLTGDFAVDAAASGSPAELAGLAAGTGIIAIGPQELSALPPVPPGDYARLEGLHDAIDAALLATGTLALKLADGRAIALAGVPVCRARFVLSASGPSAGAGNLRVRITEAALAGADDEGEAAAMIAHELAHVLLGHSQPDPAHPTTQRAREQQADRLAPWLLVNAGFDPAGMARLAQRLGKRNPLGEAFAPASHGSWGTRKVAIAAELAVIARQRQQQPDGLLDWRVRFVLPVSEAR